MEGGLPAAGAAVKTLDNYLLFTLQPGQPPAFASISQLKTAVPVNAQGRSSTGETIQPGVVSDWVIEYGAAPAVWICTQTGWYKLVRPAPEYVPVHAELQRKFDLAARSAAIMAASSTAQLAQALPLILQPQGGLAYTGQHLQMEAAFIYGQLKALAQRLPGMPALVLDFAKLVPPAVLATFTKSGSPDHQDAQDQYDADIARERAQKQAQQARDAAADLERGCPPKPTTVFRLDPSMVPDLLLVWELLMSFSHLFQLPPITLETLEAAIMPGPLPLVKPRPFVVAAPPGGYGDDEDVDDVELDFAHPEYAEGLQGAAARSPDGSHHDPMTLLDCDGVAAGAVLRDVHAALIKVIDGFSTKRLHDPPEVGKLNAEDNKSEMWQERVWQAILDPKAPADLIQPGARDSAELLKTREYVYLRPHQRLAVLRTLLELALDKEVFRDYALQKAELLFVSRPIGGYNLLPVDPDDDLETMETRGFHEPKLGEGEAEMHETWMRWLEGNRVGVRRPLGTDFRRRRYWALGNRAGCWQVFVEAAEGSAWGWYEGAGLVALTQWLKAGGIPREAALTRALQTAPIPHKYTDAPVPSYPAPLPGPPAGVNGPPTIPWTSADLRARRPDGYRTLAAPLLRGEYHQALPSGLKPFSCEDRLLNCVEALLCELDYFKQDPAVVTRVAHILEDAKARGAKGPAQHVAAVRELEALFCEMGQVKAQWSGALRDTWLRSLGREGLTSKDAAMHLAALQYFLVEQQHVMTRTAFMRQVSSMRCPLFFPVLGEVVVFLRTGCLLHLDKYTRMGQHYAVNDLLLARQRVAALPPVERFRVVSISYRSYPMLNREPILAPADHHHGSAGAAPGQKPAYPAYINPNRPPCAWLLLQPVAADQRESALGVTQEIAVPVHIDAHLPDYIVRTEAYERGMTKRWSVGERFRMYFGGKIGTKVGGVWYKGLIKEFVLAQGRPGDAHYDPWESVVVQWDVEDGTGQHKVNPWEIEMDPDERKKREEEVMKQRKASARAERAAALARRSLVKLDDELEGLGSDTDESEETDDEQEDEMMMMMAAANTTGKRPPPRRGGGNYGRKPAYSASAYQGAGMTNRPGAVPAAQQLAQVRAQQQAQQVALMQQLTRLQQMGQGNSPIALQVIQALQNLQRAQQQMNLAASSGAAGSAGAAGAGARPAGLQGNAQQAQAQLAAAQRLGMQGAGGAAGITQQQLQMLQQQQLQQQALLLQQQRQQQMQQMQQQGQGQMQQQNMNTLQQQQLLQQQQMLQQQQQQQQLLLLQRQQQMQQMQQQQQRQF